MRKWRRPKPVMRRVGSVVDTEVEAAAGGVLL